MKISLFILLLTTSVCLAQERQNVYFFNKKGQKITQRDSADFIRIIQEPDSGSVNFKLLEYYPDDRKKRVGSVSKFEPSLVYEGNMATYHRNGNQSADENYVKGRLKGPASYYYESGKLKKTGEYFEPENSKDTRPNKFPFPSFRLTDYFDSTGVQLVKNGNGRYSEYDEKGSGEEGTYADGFKHGDWKGKINGSTYTESYDHGAFKGGTAIWPDGSEHKYDKVETMPEFKGGMRNFYTYVSKTYVYPAEARRYGVKGRVVLSFVVEKDGSLTEIDLRSDPGAGTGDEAVSMLEKSPKWQPGLQHGIPVRVSYVLPIMLNLSR